MAKILVAEDERDIRDLITFTLRFSGFEVVPAIDGADAVDKAAVERPDLILMDVRMPRMTGYEACKQLKNNPVTANIPVVFLSAKGQETEVRTGLDVGATEYILKPFAPDQLAARVREVLQRNASRSA